MKKTFLFLIILITFNNIYSQNVEKLKEYEYFIESSNYEKNWIRKYILKDGLNYIIQDIHNEQGLTNEYEFFYDEKFNVIKETIKIGMSDDEYNTIIVNHKLTYNHKNLVRKESKEIFWIFLYSNFNKLNKPKIIESLGKNKQTKELMKYDLNGNILKRTEISYYTETKDIEKTEITSYKYDRYNNVTEIHRSSSPKIEYPIIMIGGPYLHEKEFYKYEYNENNLWTKKVCLINGNELYIWQRKYK